MAPNFSGKWKANLAKSNFLSAPPNTLFIQIHHSDYRIKEVIFSTRADETEERAVFTCSTTGEEGQSAWNGNPVRGKAFWSGDELIIETWLQLAGRELFFRDYWSLSDDGQTLTMEHREDALNGQRTVLDRSIDQA